MQQWFKRPPITLFLFDYVRPYIFMCALRLPSSLVAGVQDSPLDSSGRFYPPAGQYNAAGHVKYVENSYEDLG